MITFWEGGKSWSICDAAVVHVEVVTLIVGFDALDSNFLWQWILVCPGIWKYYHKSILARLQSCRIFIAYKSVDFVGKKQHA